MRENLQNCLAWCHCCAGAVQSGLARATVQDARLMNKGTNLARVVLSNTKSQLQAGAGKC
jgi:hypothetical protein